jgi:hypothetical protein
MDEYEVGYDELEEAEDDLGIAGIEVGRRKKRAKRPVDVNINAAYERGKKRVQPLLFDKVALTDVSALTTLTATAQRPCKPIKLIVEFYASYDSVAFAFVSGIRCQGINQCLSTGYGPATAFKPDAPSEDLPWDFAPLSSGGTMEVDFAVLGVSSETVYLTALAKVIAAQS